MSGGIGGGVWQTFFWSGSMVAHVPACVLDPARLARRLLRLSMVAARTPGTPQPQDIVCPRPCQWERTDTRAGSGAINPPRAPRMPGGQPDGRTDRAERPARPGTGPPDEVGRVHRSRARRPTVSATPLGMILGMPRGWRLLDLRGVHAAASDTRHQDTDGARHQQRPRHAPAQDNTTRTHAAPGSRAALLDLRCSALLDIPHFSPCSPRETMLEYANIRKNTLPYMQMFADILRFRKEIKKFNFFAIWACVGARNVVHFRRFRTTGGKTPAENWIAE